MTEQLSSGIVPEMRERLLTNRTGKLTTNQWIDIVTQPLISLLVFFAPIMAIFLPRMLIAITRGWAIMLFVLVVLAIMTAVRAVRYARAPVHFAVLEARNPAPPFWMFWRKFHLYDEQGNPVRFGKRLAPPPRVKRGKSYLVYYLKDSGDQILLSMAPAKHPEADHFRPDKIFEARLARRDSGNAERTSSPYPTEGQDTPA